MSTPLLNKCLCGGTMFVGTFQLACGMCGTVIHFPDWSNLDRAAAWWNNATSEYALRQLVRPSAEPVPSILKEGGE